MNGVMNYQNHNQQRYYHRGSNAGTETVCEGQPGATESGLRKETTDGVLGRADAKEIEIV